MSGVVFEHRRTVSLWCVEQQPVVSVQIMAVAQRLDHDVVLLTLDTNVQAKRYVDEDAGDLNPRRRHVFDLQAFEPRIEDDYVLVTRLLNPLVEDWAQHAHSLVRGALLATDDALTEIAELATDERALPFRLPRQRLLGE